MPELPEVETIRTQLADKLIGRKILDVEVRLPKIFEGNPKVVIGAKIVSVERRSKILIIKLDNNSAIAIHLKMTGQLVFGENRKKGDSGAQNDEGYMAETVSFSQGIPLAGFELPGKTTHVIFKLSDSGRGPATSLRINQNDAGMLFFNDNRQFGWVRVISNDEFRILNDKLGPEPFGANFTTEYLLKICSNWGRPIKLLLMDQEKIAGIGNIYANEALWCAGISPMKRGRDLAEGLEGQGRIRKLHDCILKVLEMGIKYQGSSVKDETYIDALGEKGSAQDHFNVYQKQGQKCPRCGKTITMSRIGGRGTFFCPACQS